MDIKEIINNLRNELNVFGEGWLAEYDDWSSKDEHQYDAILEVTNAFDLSVAGNSYFFDKESESYFSDLEFLKISIYVCEKLYSLLISTYEEVRSVRGREAKIKLIDDYFSVVTDISNSKNFAPCIVVLNGCAEKQYVLHGKISVDLCVSFFSLRELLNKRTTESIYLLYTYWRIKKTTDTMNQLIEAVTEYIRIYYYDYDNDPDMHLYYDINKLSIGQKWNIIIHWLELITYHTDNILKKYQKLEWSVPVDTLADHIVGINSITKYEMMQYKIVFSEDNDDTVRQKAICNRSYAIWIKTVDVMYIVCDVLDNICNLLDYNLNQLGLSKEAALELYDEIKKIRDHYTKRLFFHQVYFERERHYLKSSVMETLEEDADLFEQTIENTINYVGAIDNASIDELLQAKQKYIKCVDGFINKEQEKKLDDLTDSIVETIRASVEKLQVYDELYEGIADNFSAYAEKLLKYPEIFSTLVSAEYLYKQYVESADPNENFDYSGISIMYYKALEDFLNRLIYIPYSEDVLSTISEDDLNNKTWVKNTGKLYASDVNKFWAWNKRERKICADSLKKTCELGVLGYLIEGINREDNFYDYIIRKYAGIDISSFQLYGSKLKAIAPRRNEAAHGGNYLTYEDVCNDKRTVYTMTEVYRGMILELIEILFKNKS